MLIVKLLKDLLIILPSVFLGLLVSFILLVFVSFYFENTFGQFGEILLIVFSLGLLVFISCKSIVFLDKIVYKN